MPFRSAMSTDPFPLYPDESLCKHDGFTRKVHVFLYRHIGETMPDLLDGMEERNCLLFLPLYCSVWLESKIDPESLKLSKEERELEKTLDEENKEWERKHLTQQQKKNEHGQRNKDDSKPQRSERKSHSPKKKIKTQSQIIKEHSKPQRSERKSHSSKKKIKAQ